MKEMSALKESLEITRSRNEWLENEVSDTKTTLVALKKENQTLSSDNRAMIAELTQLKTSHVEAREEQTTNRSHLRALKEVTAISTAFVNNIFNQRLTIVFIFVSGKVQASASSGDAPRNAVRCEGNFD